MKAMTMIIAGVALTSGVMFMQYSPAQENPKGKVIQQETNKTTRSVFTPNDIVWTDAPATLPAGAKTAVLHGDPASPGTFTLRIKTPANYRVGPHTHPGPETVTVISGNFYVGMGSTFDETKLKKYPAGSFLYVDQTEHFVLFKEPTEIQITANGPWGINYVNPHDDPSHVSVK